MSECYGCLYGQPIHTCQPKDPRYDFHPETQYNPYPDTGESGEAYDVEKQGEAVDIDVKREEIKRRLAEMKK